MRNHDDTSAPPPGDAAEKSLGKVGSTSETDGGAISLEPRGSRARGRKAAPGRMASSLTHTLESVKRRSAPKYLTSLTFAEAEAAGIDRQELAAAARKVGLQSWNPRDRMPQQVADVFRTNATRGREQVSVEAVARLFEDLLGQSAVRRDATLDPTLRSYIVSLGSGDLVLGSRRHAVALHTLLVCVRRQPNRAALVTGPSGAGKELTGYVAGLAAGRNRVLSVNCAALAPSTVAATLFGHRRGSFTDAKDDRAGLVKDAAGGVLFLDEVHSLGATQEALLRVVENGEFLPVGATQVEHVRNTTFVMATSKPELVDPTLRARCSPRVDIPPLDERQEEVLPLARLFAARCGKALSFEALLELSSRRWTENVRGVRRVVEEGCAVADARGSAFVAAHDLLGEEPTPDAERIEALLADGKSQTAVAKLLGVHKSTVSRAARRSRSPK